MGGQGQLGSEDAAQRAESSTKKACSSSNAQPMSSSSFCFQPLRRAGLCALLLHHVVEWRAVTRSRSPSSTKNPPVPDTPRVAHAEIGRPTAVAGRSLHLGLDRRVMGVSKGGGDGCCGDGGLSTKRDTTDAQISTSDAARRRRRPPARKAAWAERRSTGRQAAEAMVI